MGSKLEPMLVLAASIVLSAASSAQSVEHSSAPDALERPGEAEHPGEVDARTQGFDLNEAGATEQKASTVAGDDEATLTVDAETDRDRAQKTIGAHILWRMLIGGRP